MDNYCYEYGTDYDIHYETSFKWSSFSGSLIIDRNTLLDSKFLCNEYESDKKIFQELEAAIGVSLLLQ